jgi:hypothetical protein
VSAQANAPRNDVGTAANAEPIPEAIAVLLGKVGELLQEGKAKPALDLIRRSRLNSPWIQNAVGVCQLRLHETDAATSLFRGMVVTATLLLRDDVPTVFKANYATALLLGGNIAGGMNVLSELKDSEHPAVGRLKEAVRQWRATLTFWQKVQWYTGGEIICPVSLSFPPGDLQ